MPEFENIAWMRNVEPVVWQWVAFGAIVLVLLALDLLVFHRHDRAPTLRESVGWTLFWIAVSLAFNGLVWLWREPTSESPTPALDFLTGYLVEKSLSMDNVFVFAVIFRFFRVPLKYQYRVLFWGILGAIVMRLAFMLAGVAADPHVRLDAAALRRVSGLHGGFKLAWHTEGEVHPDKNPVLRLRRRLFRVTRDDHHQHGHAFFVREAGRLCVTPMFLVLLVIESTDVLFAVDSVPAIFGITTDPFIVFTSNIFAILGLRALYFLLAGVIDMFRYLHYGLAAVLGFVGLKMIGDYWFPQESGHLIPTWAKLAVIAVLLAVSIATSLIGGKKKG